MQSIRRCAMRAAGSVAALFTLSFSSSAQIGPDVIVGELPATAHYGPLGSIHAYAVGTTSCNLGDQPLEWVDSTNQHPVITQNVYRLAAGRFEQLGQGWMKHGFCALQGTVCSACSPGGNCAALFPGCSDPYSASLNGSQSGLGSKCEVNPATGAYPYPFAGQGTTGDALFKRIRVSQADLSVPGALYFVSSHYVHPDEPPFGTHMNNKSYRRVTVSGTYTLNVADTTQRQKVALRAWQDHESGVTLANIDVPGDGRFIAGVKAIGLGNGSFRYEYAVENYNSDRSGSSFSVPIPAGVTVTNAGFRDVDYHSGDPYDNTDWSVSIGASSVAWTSPATHAQNPNTNALRWDTVYSFWFEANAAPTAGTVTLGLFKPGTPTTVSAALPVPGQGGGGPTPPANDDCANAITVGAGNVAFDTADATTDGPDEVGCGVDPQIAADVWYRYTPACDGDATISLCGSAFDTKLAIYAGACPTAGGAIACNDDACGSASQVTLAVSSATQYLIRVGGAAGATGSGTLAISGPDCTPPGPFNDDCANRAGVGLGVTPFDTTGATTDGPPHAGCSFFSYDQVGADIWFNFPSTINGSLTLSLCGSAFDTKLAVYDGAGCADLESRLLACADDTCGLQSEVVIDITSGQNYTIRIGGYNAATGVGQLTLSATSTSTETVWLTFAGTTTVPGAGAVADEDIVEYDGASNTWSLVFDGSDVGLAGLAIDGLAVMSNGDLLLSFTAAGTVPGITGGPGGSTTVDDSDIVRFTPTSLGPTTGGAFSFYFDGSDVGLSQNDEDVDAIALASDGRLILSTIGSASVNGAIGQDEDLLIFTATSLGATTAGSFAMYFDGSDVGLNSSSSGDVDAATLTSSGRLRLSTLSDVTVGGVSWADEDVVEFTPISLGPTTSGTYQRLLDLSTLGVSTAADVTALEVVGSGAGRAKSDALNTADGTDRATTEHEKALGAAPWPAVEIADFSGDGLIDRDDVTAFLHRFLIGDADINSDGRTDNADYRIFWEALGGLSPE